MRTELCAAAVVACVLAAGQAMAEGRWYASLSGGLLVPQDQSGTVQGRAVELEYESGGAIFGAIGLHSPTG